MKRTLAATAIVIGAVLLIGCTEINGPMIEGADWPDWKFPFDTATADFEWNGLIDPGDQIEIKGVFGGIQAAATGGNRVSVFAKKTGPASEIAKVDIEVVEHAGGVTICAVYPDVPGQHPNQCGVGDAGYASVRDSGWGAVRVEFTVLVPEGVTFTGRTVNGDVEALELRSDAFLNTVAGDVHVSTWGLASAKTVSGSISASLGETDWDRDLEFLTVTGDISVTVPAETNAEVEANVVFGDINSDFPLTVVSGGELRGTIGDGGRRLMLATVNGDIRLLRRD